MTTRQLQQVEKAIQNALAQIAATNKAHLRDLEELHKRVAALQRGGRPGGELQIIEKRAPARGIDPKVVDALQVLAKAQRTPWDRDRVEIVLRTYVAKNAAPVDVTKAGKASRS